MLRRVFSSPQSLQFAIGGSSIAHSVGASVRMKATAGSSSINDADVWGTAGVAAAMNKLWPSLDAYGTPSYQRQQPQEPASSPRTTSTQNGALGGSNTKAMGNRRGRSSSTQSRSAFNFPSPPPPPSTLMRKISLSGSATQQQQQRQTQKSSRASSSPRRSRSAAQPSPNTSTKIALSFPSVSIDMFGTKRRIGSYSRRDKDTDRGETRGGGISATSETAKGLMSWGTVDNNTTSKKQINKQRQTVAAAPTHIKMMKPKSTNVANGAQKKVNRGNSANANNNIRTTSPVNNMKKSSNEKIRLSNAAERTDNIYHDANDKGSPMTMRTSIHEGEYDFFNDEVNLRMGQRQQPARNRKNGDSQWDTSGEMFMDIRPPRNLQQRGGNGQPIIMKRFPPSSSVSSPSAPPSNRRAIFSKSAMRRLHKKYVSPRRIGSSGLRRVATTAPQRRASISTYVRTFKRPLKATGTAAAATTAKTTERSPAASTTSGSVNIKRSDTGKKKSKSAAAIAPNKSQSIKNGRVNVATDTATRMLIKMKKTASNIDKNLKPNEKRRSKQQQLFAKQRNGRK